MKVVQANSGLLSNPEVLAVLEDRGCGGSAPPGARSLASEKMVHQYLAAQCVGARTTAQLSALLAALRPFDLTRVEALQVINLAPASAVEVHLIVEACEERLGEEQVEQLLAVVAEHLPKPE